MTKGLYPIRRAETGAQVGELPYPFVIKQMQLSKCAIEWVDNHWLITGEPNRCDLMCACSALMASNDLFERADWSQGVPTVTVQHGARSGPADWPDLHSGQWIFSARE